MNINPKKILVFFCFLGVQFPVVFAQGYLNSLSCSYGLSYPKGEYSYTSSDIKDVISGMSRGENWGVELKTRVFNLVGTSNFRGYSVNDYMNKITLIVQYERFVSSISESSIMEIEKNGMSVTDYGDWRISSLLFGLSYTFDISDNTFLQLKSAMGVTHLGNPLMIVKKEDQIMFQRNSNTINTHGTMFGLDFVFDFGKIRLQLQNELFWAVPELNAVTWDNKVGEMIQFQQKEDLFIPQLKLSIGYNFLE